LIFSTVALTATTPCASSLTAQSWILRPSRKTSLSIVSGAKPNGAHQVDRHARDPHRHLRRIFSAAQTTSAAAASRVALVGSHGPAACGLVTTLLPSTRKDGFHQ